MCIALARSRIDCIRSHWIRIAHGSHGSIVSNSNLLVQPMPSKIAMSRPPPAPNEPSSQSHNWDQPGSTPVNSPSNLRRVVPVPPIFHWDSRTNRRIIYQDTNKLVDLTHADPDPNTPIIVSDKSDAPSQVWNLQGLGPG